MSSRRRVWAALVVVTAWSLPLQGAVLQLAPIPIEVEAPQSAAVLRLGNRASAEVTLQVRVFRWQQEDGEDRLEPTDAVVVSPPIATVPAGQTLTVRVIRRAPQAPAAEESYRVWVDELPVSGDDSQGRSALRVLTRYSVPAFFAPRKAAVAEPKLTWRLALGRDGELRLTASNAGARRARISSLQLRTPEGEAKDLAAGDELSGYVLAGQAMRWTLKPRAPFPVKRGARYRLSYKTEGGSHRESVALDPAR